MFAESLHLHHYRNIEKEKVFFEKEVNFLYGENAQGKTNILEALYFYARGKSFRGASDKEQVSFGKEGYETCLVFSDKSRRQEMSYVYDKGEKTRKRNGMKIEKATDFLGHFRSVLFFPEDLKLVKGGPEERRAFLNVAISQCNHAYLTQYATYRRCLEQRNALIKYAQKNNVIDEDQLYSWSVALAKSAAFIHKERIDYLKNLSLHTASFLSELSCQREKIELLYESNASGDHEEELFNSYLYLLTQNWNKEIVTGFSLYGIHRDDVDIKINKKEARQYASQGQQRSIVLSMKMAEGAVCQQISGESPVFLFDDVLSELDESRRKFLLEEIKGPQIIITGCDDSLFRADKTNIIEVKEGHYVSAHRQR